MKLVFIVVLVYLIFTLRTISASENFSKNDFIQQAFSENIAKVESKTLWLDESIQSQITAILGHQYPKLRLRYKQLVLLDQSAQKQLQSVWFLDEIGKERPISFAINIINGHIEQIEVLAFRESRGGEIQMPGFSKQFQQVRLTAEHQLDKTIDGISGATMSVSAMKKIARVALLLHQIVFQESAFQ